MVLGGRTRTAALSGIAVVALAVAAPAQITAADIENYWDGEWKTYHTGVHTMFLSLDQKRGSETVTGTFRHKLHDGSKGSTGTITAAVTNDRGTKLEGRYKDTKNGSAKGAFRIHLEKNDVGAFEGKFGPCKWWKPWCDEPTVAWSGTNY